VGAAPTIERRIRPNGIDLKTAHSEAFGDATPEAGNTTARAQGAFRGPLRSQMKNCAIERTVLA
jgi:hypothetical protein